MSNIRHLFIITKTENATLQLNEMGEIVANSPTNMTIALPTATNHRGLWYRFININTGVANISSGSMLLSQGESGIAMSDGTSWIYAKHSTNIEYNTHIDTKITDDNGVHGIQIDSTPIDGYYLKWDEASGMYVHDLP